MSVAGSKRRRDDRLGAALTSLMKAIDEGEQGPPAEAAKMKTLATSISVHSQVRDVCSVALRPTAFSFTQTRRLDFCFSANIDVPFSASYSAFGIFRLSPRESITRSLLNCYVVTRRHWDASSPMLVSLEREGGLATFSSSHTRRSAGTFCFQHILTVSLGLCDCQNFQQSFGVFRYQIVVS